MDNKISRDNWVAFKEHCDKLPAKHVSAIERFMQNIDNSDEVKAGFKKGYFADVVKNHIVDENMTLYQLCEDYNEIVDKHNLSVGSDNDLWNNVELPDFRKAIKKEKVGFSKKYAPGMAKLLGVSVDEVNKGFHWETQKNEDGNEENVIIFLSPKAGAAYARYSFEIQLPNNIFMRLPLKTQKAMIDLAENLYIALMDSFEKLDIALNEIEHDE